jgi:Outer membrane protein beta-barrel domain
MRKVIAILILLAPALAFAQSDGVELTPNYGFRWGGKLYAQDSSLITHDVDIKSSDTYGLNLDFPVTEHIQIELMATKQSTTFGNDSGLFTPSAGDVNIDITYSHVGMLWQFPVRDWAPYVVYSIGVGHINPSLAGATSENRFSASVGGGFKLRLAEHLGLRIEGRGYWTDLSGWNDRNNNNNDHHCRHDDNNCNNHDLVQAAVTAGLIIRF